MNKLVILGCLAAASLAAQERLVFTKSFPGSVPAYCSLRITRDGTLEYSEAETDDNPIRAKLQQSVADGLFEMAGKLDHFKGKLESGLRVANTGKKVFRYESPSGEKSESVFNYSTDPVAQQLLDQFEQIAESERAYINLDRAVHFDKLGVNDALAEIESLWLRKELAAPPQFVPLLNRIATHESFMHLARERAARLKEGFSAAQ